MFEHYYTEKPQSALRFHKIKTVIRGFKLDFETSTGVFSPRRIDNATRLLCENMIIRKGERVLDLGAGYGVIGIVAAKLGGVVTLSDVNERAVMLALKNTKTNKVNATVVKSRTFSDLKAEFDNIIINPPIAAGIKVCTDMIINAYEHLSREGVLQLVARHNKGGSRLQDFMQEVFNNVRVTAKKAGFKVYLSQKSD